MNNVRLGHTALAVFTALILCVHGPEVANAQELTLPPELLVSKRDIKFISVQLRMSSDFGRQTLARLETMSTDDTVPFDENIVQTARNTYALIRAARHGLEFAQDTKFPDPSLALVFKRVDAAWNLSRTPVDLSHWGVTRQDYRDRSIRDLSQAMRLVNQALMLLP